MTPLTPLNIDEFEAIARERMERSAYDYYAGGSGEERTLAANREAFNRIPLRPRVLIDVSQIDTRTTVLGQPLALPVMLAPTAFNRLAHADGEMAAARAARAAGTIMIGSTLSTCALEDVAGACEGPLWFQLYVYKDRGFTQELVARAEAAGYRALVLTVDTPLLGRRYRDVRNNFVLPEGITMKNFEAAMESMTSAARWGAHSSFSAYVHDLFDATLSWTAVEWLRTQTRLPIVVKGVMTEEDGHLAVSAGADGVIVSNHGGRQLDGALASIDALPEVVDAVAGRADVLMDGGIRRGTDVLKALAFGAHAVCIGRPYLWALAANGEQGVSDALRILKDELSLAMALSGRPTVSSIDRSLVQRRPPVG
ncbi:MAG: alpha-hydroxy-acid oxidizing protein [Acidobacteriota bacterium]|nr:alpha-hydroxy-acid oxidizing protein [Acidobacteriota bacterium]